MGDHERFARFLGVRQSALPNDVDTILDPKEFIVNLARSSHRKSFARDLIPRPGSGRSTGAAFNSTMLEFANSLWRARVASAHSDSLARALRALDAFVPH